MSESIGLQRLTEYLNQTRRQAELAIDTLNNRLKELQDELDRTSDALVNTERERDSLKLQCEQLKLESSKKYRLQERDDWKSLVESIQKDRSRLADELAQTQLLLDESRNECALYQAENEELASQLQQAHIPNSGRATSPARINSEAREAPSPTRLLIDSLQQMVGDDDCTPSNASPSIKRNRSPSSSARNSNEVETLKQLVRLH
jgi:chromosome segregation ATPase